MNILILGAGKNLSGFWSRRIDETNRLVYVVDGVDLVVIACRYHY